MPNPTTVIAHQHETLDDVCYRTIGTTRGIAAVMDANPLALSTPRLVAGTPVHIPLQTVSRCGHYRKRQRACRWTGAPHPQSTTTLT